MRSPPVVIGLRLSNAPAFDVAAVPPFAIGIADPENETARVPVVVTGEPVTLRNAGTVRATDETVPEPPPGGTAHVPSALRKFADPPPDPGTTPLRDEVNASRSAVSCVELTSKGVEPEPVLLPLYVCAAMDARFAFEIAADPERFEFVSPEISAAAIVPHVGAALTEPVPV